MSHALKRQPIDCLHVFRNEPHGCSRNAGVVRIVEIGRDIKIFTRSLAIVSPMAWLIAGVHSESARYDPPGGPGF